MAIGEREPLLLGDTITQTFQTDRTVLSAREFYGLEILDKDYCYMEVGPIVPKGKSTYIVKITPLYTTAAHYLTFRYYNTRHYDLYTDGSMTGLNSDERSDLTFMIFNRVEKTYFH